MKRQYLYSILFFIMVGFGFNAQAGVIIKVKPPAVKVEVRPKAKFKNAVWVNGRWNWNGRKHVWVKGYWVRPRAGHVWVAGRWAKRPGGYVWIKGHWKKKRVVVVRKR